jgi:hypothetical protein
MMPAPALQAVASPRITTSQIRASSSGGIDPLFHTNASTFLGGPGIDVLEKVKSTSSGPVVAGFSTDPVDSTAVDLFVAKLSNDLSTATTAHVYFGAGVKFFGRGLDVAADGTVYVDGYTGQDGFNRSGVSNLYVLSIRADLGAINWAVGYVSATVRSAGYGLRLDSTGTNLYFSGTYDFSGIGFPTDNFLVGKLTNLTASSPTTVYSSGFVFNDSMGHPTPSFSNSIGPDSRGVADAVGTYVDGPNVKPLEAQVNTAGTGLLSAGAFPSVGTQGKGIDVIVDSANNYLISGSFTLSGHTNPSFFYAKFSSSGAEAWDFEWTLTTNSGGTPLSAYATGIRTDSLGYVYVSLTVTDPSSPGNIKILDVDKFSPTGGGFIDGTLGAIGGSNSDWGLGLDVASGNNPVFLAGTTLSPDFPTTPGVVQPTYGGGTDDGVLLSVTLGT